MASFFSGGLEDRFSSSRALRISDPPAFNPQYSRDSFLGSATRGSRNNPTSAINDSRNLHRRFTTSYSSLAQQRRSAFDSPAADLFAFQPSISPAEKKKQEYEQLKQKRLERQRRLDVLNQESHREELELARLSQELGIDHSGVGHQSEPTTPPEYRDTGFPTSLSRPNRFSAGNLISPTGLFSGKAKMDSQLASPPNERARAYNALTAAAPSGPHSRNGSDEEDSQEEVLDFNHRSAASFNRNSMPVTRRDLGSNGDPALGPVNTHRFLFGDEDNKADHHLTSTPRPKSFFHRSEKDDFPVLLKRDLNGNMQYSSGANATEMSSADDSDPSSSQASKRSSMHRAFASQALNGAGMTGTPFKSGDSPPFGFSQASPSEPFSPTKGNASSNRHSLGASTSLASNARRPGFLNSPPSEMADGTGTPKLQSSYSTGNIPTVKNVGHATNYQHMPQYQDANSTAEQRLHSHNSSLGRIPPQGLNNTVAASKHHSRELSSSSSSKAEENIFPSLTTVLQSGMNGSQQQSPQGSGSLSGSNPTVSELGSPFAGQLQSSPLSQSSYNGGYSVGGQINALNTAMGGLSMGMTPAQQWNPAAHQWNGSAPYGQAYQGYPNFPGYAGGRFSDSSSQRSSRRGQSGDEPARFSQFRLEDLIGQVYGLCTDQNGCRYLQKKLEEGSQDNIQIIFEETKDHMVDLMTDPFGNYLVQKLLEHTGPEQHTVLINNAAAHMVKIALNQHGTRALQKMIEYVVEEPQIDTLVQALRFEVVPMIQDLNGNHVIQKCLNRLAAPNIQFIIDAVAAHCIVVGTHRHGCCVIQRCIDHATPDQKAHLVSSITQCSLPLVQDPFGNYVLQYIFDQGESSYSQLLCRTFLGRIVDLSKQKFSSNVIEKCIRIADTDTKHEMIEEILNYPDFDRVADDAFANYVVQTAWDNADENDEARLAEKIRPVLARMRHKPYGRRFQSRLNERDKRFGLGTGSSPSEMTSPAMSIVQANMLPQTGSAMFNAHLDNGFGQSGFGINNPQFAPPPVQSPLNASTDYTRPMSHRINTPAQSAFSPMNAYQSFNLPNQQFGTFAPSFGRPAGY